MPISISSVYADVQFQIHKDNGTLTFTDFNRLSVRAENRIQEWLTGDVRQGINPYPFGTQKNKDLLAPFITTHKSILDSEGRIEIPSDYCSYENMYSLSLENICDDKVSCDDKKTEISKIPIELLDGQAFYYRANTFISGLKPSTKKPIAKQVSNQFEFLPKDIQGVVLEYIRFPKYGTVVTTIDPIYNEEVIDEAASTNYEWDEKAREMLVYFITDLYSNHIRETALKQFNDSTGKTVTK